MTIKNKHAQFLKELNEGKTYNEAMESACIDEKEVNLVLGKLTRHQKKIVMGLINGETLEEISVSQGIYIYSVRSTMESIIERVQRTSRIDEVIANVDLESLTTKQKNVMIELRKGKTTQEIAIIENVTEGSITQRIEAIIKKHRALQEKADFVNKVNQSELTEKQKLVMDEFSKSTHKSQREIAESLNVHQFSVKSIVNTVKKNAGVKARQLELDMDLELLTSKQREVIEEMRTGKTAVEVAELLGVSRITVYKRIESAKRRVEKLTNAS